MCDTELSSRLMLELVRKVELAADHEVPDDTREVRPSGSLDIWLLLNSDDANVIEV